MSDINNYTNIEFAGKNYEVAMTLEVIDRFQDKFNCDFFELEEMLKDTRKLYKIVRYLLFIMINDSIRRNNKKNGTSEPLFEEWEIGDKLDFDEVIRLVRSIKEAFYNSLPEDDGTEVEEDTP